MRNKDNADRLGKYAAVRFSRKSGKIDKTLTGTGFAMLGLWALQNTTKTKDSIVFSLDNGLVIGYYTGTDSGMPKVDYGTNGETIDKYCAGLLEAIAE